MTWRTNRAGVAALGVAALLALPGRASADDVVPTFHLEGTADVMLTDGYRDRFDWGGAYAIRAGVELVGPLAVQASFANGWFPVDGQDPGALYAFELGARVFVPIEDGPLGGPFLDFNLGLGLTGELARFTFDVGLGWDFFPVELVGVGAVVRYGQIVQPDDEPIGDDAHLLAFGVNLTLRLDLAEEVAEEVEEPAPVAPTPPAPRDTDDDGVHDADDACPDAAEDRDGFRDEDGCPDPDNDGDGYADGQDTCPDAAETRNGFQDDDGCPDDAPPPAPVTDREAGTPLPQAVLFRSGSDRVSPRFAGAMAEVCALLSARPRASIRVIGHADEQGTAAANHRLGAQRAGAVAEQLVLCGVSPARIESRSYGDTRRRCDEPHDDCRAQNRRVELRLLADD